MKLVGLTGGIASGKTAVARRLIALGAHVIDADDVYRELTQPKSALLTSLSEAFGREILREDGSLNRRALSAIAFSDADGRSTLNALTHPAIIGRMHELASEYNSMHPDVPVFLDMALLIECGEQANVDEVWLVTAPEEKRIERMLLRDGCTAPQAKARIEAQLPESEKLRYADTVIENSGTLDELNEIVDASYRALMAKDGEEG